MTDHATRRVRRRKREELRVMASRRRQAIGEGVQCRSRSGDFGDPYDTGAKGPAVELGPNYDIDVHLQRVE